MVMLAPCQVVMYKYGNVSTMPWEQCTNMVMLAPCQEVMYESGNVSTMPGNNVRIW